MGFGKRALTPTPTHTQVRARGDNVGLGRVPRDLILVEILPRALVAPRHYWRHLTDAAAAPAAFPADPSPGPHKRETKNSGAPEKITT